MTEKIKASNLLIAALQEIRHQLLPQIFTSQQDPFDNTSDEYICPVFEIKAYSWNEEENEEEQDYNFKYKDILVTWYKYLGRSTEVNREVSPQEISDMLDKCLNYLYSKDV